MTDSKILYTIYPVRSIFISVVMLTPFALGLSVLMFLILKADFNKYPSFFMPTFIFAIICFCCIPLFFFFSNLTKTISIEVTREYLIVKKKIFPFTWFKRYELEMGVVAESKVRSSPGFIPLMDSDFFGYGNFEVKIRYGTKTYLIANGLRKSVADECASFINESSRGIKEKI